MTVKQPLHTQDALNTSTNNAGTNNTDTSSSVAEMPWVVMTDGRKARIMALQDGHAFLIEELREPHIDGTDLLFMNGPSAAPAQSLAQMLVQSLEEKYRRRQFSSLIIMASTQMMDQMYRHFSDDVRTSIIAIAHKSVSQIEENALMLEIAQLSPEIGRQLAKARNNSHY